MKPTAKSLFTLSLLVPLAVVPGTAHAQLKPEIQTGSMIPVKPKPVDKKDAGLIRKQFARCIYRSSPVKVMALLNNSDAASVDLAAAKIKNVGDELGMERCLGNQVGINQLALEMRFSSVYLRDLMAEEAYLGRNRVAPQLAPTAPPLAGKFVSTGDDLTRAQTLAAFGDCAIRADVTHADALLRTTPASQAEHASAAVLAPALGMCLRQGEKVVLTQASIRAIIAYAMWTRFGQGAVK